MSSNSLQKQLIHEKKHLIMLFIQTGLIKLLIENFKFVEVIMFHRDHSLQVSIMNLIS
jgi:hypothetical protein